ncbi:hypothetical protein EDM27_15250, partial [Staphylococcus aureus]
YFDEQELIEPFNKKFLGNIIAEVFNRFSITDTSYWCTCEIIDNPTFTEAQNNKFSYFSR